MKHFLAFVLTLSPIFVPGCGHPPAKVAPPVAKAKPGMDESLKTAVELLRQATTPAHYRDALNLVDQYLVRNGGAAIKVPSKDTLGQLTRMYGLSEGETRDLTAATFQPADAPFVESCFWFRDTARALEMPLASPLVQARICLDWTCRNLMLHEQGDEGLPPLLALRRGFGGARDRALVFLQLLRQFGIEGCLVEIGSETATNRLLVGVLAEESDEANFFLFDPRAGRPIPGPDGKGIATLELFRDHPETYGIDPKESPSLRTRVVGQLSALAPRMRFLENQFLGQEKIVLYQDGMRLLAVLREKAGESLVPWSAEESAWTPVRAWKTLLPFGEGGYDKTNRSARYRFELLPWPVVVGRFAQLRLYNDLPDTARNTLMSLTADLLAKYLLQPEEYLLRGRFDDAFTRLNRIGNALEDLTLASTGDAAFAQEVAQWRERLNEVYAGLLRKEERALGRVNALWAEDQYFANLLDPDSDVPANRFRRGTLTKVVLTAARPVLAQHSSWLTARCWEEKAERAQTHLELLQAAKKVDRAAEEAARSAWNNTRANWNRYVDRHGMTANLEPRLQALREALERGEADNAVAGWERLHLDLHRSLAARQRLARALIRHQSLRKENAKVPRAALEAQREAARELAMVLDHPTWRKDLQKAADQLRTGQPHLAQRLDLLLRDFEPLGPLALREAAVKEE